MSALLAARALVHDYQYGDINAAAAFYIEAAETILTYRRARRSRYQSHAAWYIDRAETLHTGYRNPHPHHRSRDVKTTGGVWQGVFEAMPPYLLPYHARACLRAALSEDENHNFSDAIAFYSTAAAAYHKLSGSQGHSPEARQRAEHRVRELVERAEALREIKQRNDDRELCGPQNGKDEYNNNHEDKRRGRGRVGGERRRRRRRRKDKLTDEEKEVLRAASRVEGDRLFMPWLDAFDLPEAFPANTQHAFTDPDGQPGLSKEQQAAGVRWERPSTVFGEDTVSMVRLISALTIRQTVVTDCSFIASLCVAANYERRQGRALVSRCIFPQNATGTPVYNPGGKYLVKLYFNGIARKVVVDDCIPVDAQGQIAGSHTVSEGELWVTILEKAYMKVRGSYAGFQSTSTADLHALTGWIPVSIPITSATADPDRTWRMLHRAFRSAACIATANMGDAHADSNDLGLAPHHSYAILDVREVFGLRLLQLKNPWMHGRWCGPFSHCDRARWTPELQRELNYSVWRALEEDAGVFWIDYESVLTYMAELCLSFDPTAVCGYGSDDGNETEQNNNSNNGNDNNNVNDVDGTWKRNRNRHITKEKRRNKSGDEDYINVKDSNNHCNNNNNTQNNNNNNNNNSENRNIQQIHTRGWWWTHPATRPQDAPPLSITSDRRTVVCNPQFMVEISTVDYDYCTDPYIYNNLRNYSMNINETNHNCHQQQQQQQLINEDVDDQQQQQEAWLLLTIHRTAATSLSLPYTALLVYPLTHKGSGPPKMYRRRHIPVSPLLPANYSNSSHILVRVPLSRGKRHRFVCVVSQEGSVLRPVSMTLSLYCPAVCTARQPPPALIPLPSAQVLTSRTVTLRPQSRAPVLWVRYEENNNDIDRQNAGRDVNTDNKYSNSTICSNGKISTIITELAAEVVETGAHGSDVKVRVCAGVKKSLDNVSNNNNNNNSHYGTNNKEIKGKWRRGYAVLGKELKNDISWIRIDGRNVTVSTAVRVILWTQENEVSPKDKSVILLDSNDSDT